METTLSKEGKQFTFPDTLARDTGLILRELAQAMTDRALWRGVVSAVSTLSDHLRTFARKFSKIDFFLQILPLEDDELVM